MQKILTYHRGQWTEQDFPVADSTESDFEKFMQDGGYAHATAFHPGGDSRSLTLTVWANGADATRPGLRAESEDAPKYLLDIEFSDVTSEIIGAVDVADLMELLTRWIPAVESAARLEDAQEIFKEKMDALYPSAKKSGR